MSVIILDDTQKAVTPPLEVPEVEYPIAWATQVLIQWPHGTAGTASVEMHPMSADGTKVLLRKPDGSDAVIKTRIDNLAGAMGRCHELAAVFGPLVEAIHAWNAIVIADARAAAQAEADRLAQLEADRLAAIEAARIAEEERLAAMETARLAGIEAARIAAEAAALAEADRIAAYNMPEAKAARVAAAKSEVDRLQAIADQAAAELEKAQTPEVLAAIALQSAIEDQRQKEWTAQSALSQAASAAAELERLQAE